MYDQIISHEVKYSKASVTHGDNGSGTKTISKSCSNYNMSSVNGNPTQHIINMTINKW
jgi:hypothetical protein